MLTHFKTKKLNTSKIFAVINVGSYKVRVVICEFSSNEIKVLGYGEKRQSRLDILNSEINNLSGVCSTIAESILKAEEEAGIKCNDIVINPFFSNTFFYSKAINYKRSDPEKEIDKKELFKIVESVEKIGIASIMKEIEDKFGYKTNDVSIILSSITKITSSGKEVNNLINTCPEDIKIKTLNSFIPRENLHIIQDIGNYLSKNIIHIIPEEYAITKIAQPRKSIVLINIGNLSTFISIVQTDGSLVGTVNLDIGMDELLKNIQKTSERSRIEIIRKLDRNDLFKEEKSEFLSYFSDFLIAGLKEILGNRVCPHNFTITGGGASNVFIKEHIKNIHYQRHGIKIVKDVKLIIPSVNIVKKIVGVEDILKVSNINLISQIISLDHILKKQNNLIEKALQKSISKILKK